MPKGIYKRTEEYKRKLSESHKGKISGMKGKHHSEETKLKIRKLHAEGKLKAFEKGNQWAFKKGHKPLIPFKKGHIPANYIDGRSRKCGIYCYGDDWNEIRKIIYRRDYYTCQRCGIKGIKLDVHHIIPFLDGGSNELDNLISLCRRCHMKEDYKYIQSFKKKKIGRE